MLPSSINTSVKDVRAKYVPYSDGMLTRVSTCIDTDFIALDPDSGSWHVVSVVLVFYHHRPVL